MITNSHYSENYIVNFGDLANIQSSGVIVIPVPNNSCNQVAFSAKDVRYESEGDYTWYGTYEWTEENGCNCYDGDMMLFSSADGRIGQFRVNESTYEITDLGNSLAIFSKVNPLEISGSCTNIGSGPLSSIGESRKKPIKKTIEARTGAQNCNIRVLVCYTTRALNFLESFAQVKLRANLAVQQTNQAFKNSAISDCDLKLTLAGVDFLAFDEKRANGTDKNMGATIAEISQAPLRTDINNLLFQRNADLVILLRAGSSDDGFGRAFIDDINNPLGTCLVSQSTTNLTFAHEVGHIIGARHQESGGNNADPTTPADHGHKMVKGPFLPCLFGYVNRTIMYSPDDEQPGSGTRILHYSNPDVRYQGLRTGRYGERVNTNKLKGNGCAVASINQYADPFYVNLEGQRYGCPCEPIVLSAMAVGGYNGSYVFNWYESDDGVNYVLKYVGTNTNTYMVTLPCIEGNKVFVKVVTTSGNVPNQLTATNFCTLTPMRDYPGQIGLCMERSSKEILSSLKFAVNPNPVSGSIRLEIEAIQSESLNIKIFDRSGKLAKEMKNLEVKKGKGMYEVDAADIVPGLYQLVLSNYVSAVGSLAFVKK